MAGPMEREFLRERRNPVRRSADLRGTQQLLRTPGSLQGTVSTLPRTRLDTTSQRWRANLGLDSTEKDETIARSMATSRRSMRRHSQTTRGDAQWAFPVQRDPWEFWREKTWWFDLEKSEEDETMSNFRKWCRLIYKTHHLVPSLIDIYARFPILDIEFVHKDKEVVKFYEDLFFGQLDYHEHLFNMGREHWTTGEVFSLGHWHPGVGIWEEEEIINPDDVVVAKNRLLRSHNFHIKVPQDIKDLLSNREPRAEYEALISMFPEMVDWARDDKEIPVSDVLLHQIKFETEPWSTHGTPILLRAFRQLMLEESLTAAQEAVADRFYSPLILAKLGLDNVDDMGPWLPEPEELDALRDDLHLTLNSDFRLMVYHHGLDIKSVFGRETMPRLDQDFARIDGALMGVFGIGEELLKGGKSNTAYASGALNRELITQMLTTYQNRSDRFIKDRMEPVAERHQLYEYEKRGGQRVLEMETVLGIDEETGEEFIQERPKLAIPEIRFRSMNLRDESVEREFLQQLKADGFPVSFQTMAVNIEIDFDEEREKVREEKKQVVLEELQYKDELFRQIVAQKLVVPQEMEDEFLRWIELQNSDDPVQSLLDSKAHNEMAMGIQQQQSTMMGMPGTPGVAPQALAVGSGAGEDTPPPVGPDTNTDPALPDAAIGDPAPAPNIGPSDELEAKPKVAPETINPQDKRPDISDEQRATQPRRASRLKEVWGKIASKLREDVEEDLGVESILNPRIASTLAENLEHIDPASFYTSRAGTGFKTPEDSRFRRLAVLTDGMRVVGYDESPDDFYPPEEDDDFYQEELDFGGSGPG